MVRVFKTVSGPAIKVLWHIPKRRKSLLKILSRNKGFVAHSKKKKIPFENFISGEC